MPHPGRCAVVRIPAAPLVPSENEQDHHEDYGNDQSENGNHAGVHGVSEPLGMDVPTLLRSADHRLLASGAEFR